jgi:hypothetical protein
MTGSYLKSGMVIKKICPDVLAFVPWRNIPEEAFFLNACKTSVMDRPHS